MLVLNAVITDLQEDIRDIIEYLTPKQNEAAAIRLLPIDRIIAELKEVATHLTEGLHFPFRVQIENWHTIQAYASINAYFSSPCIYTIIKFPIVAYPTYDVIKAIPLPKHDYNNVFAIIRITQPLAAISKSSHTYLQIEEKDLTNCIKEKNAYTCEQNLPKYHIQANAPCEIQMYAEPTHVMNCETRHIISNTTLWITLTEPQTWLYSTIEKEKATIECDNQVTNTLTFERTGKLKINKHCKLTTNEITIITKNEISAQQIEYHLPETNLTLTQEKILINTAQEPKLKQVIRNPAELTKYSRKLKELTGEINTNGYILTSKEFIYSTGTVTTIIIITLVIAVSIYIYKQKKKQKINKISAIMKQKRFAEANTEM
jgi:hypothetical protein